MSLIKKSVISACLFLILVSPGYPYDFGRPATADEIALWDIDVRPDGKGLPLGYGMVSQGKAIFTENCEACHGVNGQGGIKDQLVGGVGSLASDNPVKTIGSFWPYATTLFDYIRRAMPYQAPGSLSSDETYALVAYILNLNDIVPPQATVDRLTLPMVKMPNREGFLREPEFDLIGTKNGSH